MPTTTRPVTPALHVPSRRTVLRAAAWTAPAVSVAVAVPAYAACSPASVVDATSYLLDWGVDAVGRKTSVARLGVAAWPRHDGALSRSTVDLQPAPAPSSLKLSGDNLAVPPQTNLGGLGSGATGLRLDHAAAFDGRQERRSGADPQLRPAGERPVVHLTDIDSQTRGLVGPASAVPGRAPVSVARRGVRGSRRPATTPGGQRRRDNSAAGADERLPGNVRRHAT